MGKYIRKSKSFNKWFIVEALAIFLDALVRLFSLGFCFGGFHYQFIKYKMFK